MSDDDEKIEPVETPHLGQNSGRISGPLGRIAAWSAVAVVAAMVPFSAQLGQRALADNLPRVRSIQARPEYLHLEMPTTVQEGQDIQLKLGWRNLPAAAQLETTPLTVSWSDTSYTGEALNPNQVLEMGISLRRLVLHFESSGSHQVKISGPDGQVWKTQEIDVTPFPASIFPKDWTAYRKLEQDPKRFQLLVNLYYDFKHPDKQRQYVQITYDDQILDRFLVSSGAPGHDTPLGSFKVGNKEYYPRSHKYNDAAMPFWSAINIHGNQGEYGFHSLEGGAYLYYLGRPASHGCVRLSRQSSLEVNPDTGQRYWGDRGGARWIFDRVPKETPVTIFKRELPRFAFEDYAMYLARQAREYRQRQKQQTEAESQT